MQELIDKIAAAEKEADAMIAAALDDARTMSLNADAKAAEIRQAAKERVKNEKKQVIATAEAEAELRYNEIVDLGKREVDKLFSATDTGAQSKAVALAFRVKYGNR